LSSYRKENRLFTAYLATKSGNEVFLHALLKFLEKDKKNIDLCINNLCFMLFAIDKIKKDFFSFFKKCGVKKVEIVSELGLCVLPVQEKGKILRFIETKQLKQDEFLFLLQISEKFAGCRGDGSFSEAVSLDKVFFYDARSHAKYFLEDLLELSRNRIENYPSSIQYLSLFSRTLKLSYDADFEKETFFQDEKKLSSEKIGKKMGKLLQNPLTIEGIEKLNKIIREDYSVNETLCNLVARAVFHYHHPEVEEKENNLIKQFLEGKSFCDVMQKIRGLLKTR
jgi:hypothetical protein